jgi:hypothetical protein
MTSQTELLRQIHPNWHRDGVVLSRGFTPTNADAGQLSVDDGDQIDADEAYRHFTQTVGLSSAGTWSVTIDEANLLGLPALANSLSERPNRPGKQPDPLPNWPSHSLIDFTKHDEKARKEKAAILADIATKRGVRHTPPI